MSFYERILVLGSHCHCPHFHFSPPISTEMFSIYSFPVVCHYPYIIIVIVIVIIVVVIVIVINTPIVRHIYIHIYIYIKWTVFVNVTTKSAQHAHARMIAIIVEKSPNSSHLYDHGFMDYTNRQAVKIFLIHKQVIRPLRHGGSHFASMT